MPPSHHHQQDWPLKGFRMGSASSALKQYSLLLLSAREREGETGRVWEGREGRGGRRAREMQMRPVEVEQPCSQSVLPGWELREAGTRPTWLLPSCSQGQASPVAMSASSCEEG